MTSRRPVTKFVRELFAASVEQRSARREALRAFHDALRAELERSRRYERRFVLVSAELAVSPHPAGEQHLVAALQSAVRSTDEACIAERRLYLLLPEVDATAALMAFERIRAMAPDALVEQTLAIAAFPQDGVTMGALLARLREGAVQHGSARANPRPDVSSSAN